MIQKRYQKVTRGYCNQVIDLLGVLISYDRVSVYRVIQQVLSDTRLRIVLNRLS